MYLQRITGELFYTLDCLLKHPLTAYVSIQNLKATQRNVLVAEEKQVTERFTQAINQLGSDKIEIRLGGIYALERIARDSLKDHWTIMEVLTSFIQEKSPLIAPFKYKEVEYFRPIAKDVQAALTVIGRRDLEKDPEYEWLDLSGAYLVKANLHRAYLKGINFRNANLCEAIFTDAELTGASLGNANLSGAQLDDVCLDRADLSNADLSNARLIEAHLAHADLSNANLNGAILIDADLDGVDLKAALDSEKAHYEWEETETDEALSQRLGLSSKQKS